MNNRSMLKHFICMISVLVIIGAVCGCSRKNDNETGKDTVTVDKNNDPSTAPEATPAKEPVSTPIPTKEPVPTEEPIPTKEPVVEPTVEPEPIDGISEICSFSDILEDFYAADCTIPETLNVVTGKTPHTVVVSDVEGLLEAIAPNTTVLIEPGYYNMSYFLNGIEYDGIEIWNDTHSCVKLEQVYDGIEVHIYNVPNLQIIGNGATREDTELVIDPRCASVFTFDSCSDLVLSNFKVGHTMMGDCAGNVIDFIASNEIIVDNMDIYGCGVTGLAFILSSGNILVNQSYIHDCSIGPFDLSYLWGYMFCVDCEFNNSANMGYCPCEEQDCIAVLYRCTMGSGESVERYYREPYFYDIDCTWSEPSYYPDYEEYYE